jgi:hypothetical protein
MRRRFPGGFLVVAEDCDEYLRSDAKVRADTSLGRLLNFCDGILGHGLEVLVLLTTNEDVGRAAPCDHPSRPVLEPGGVHLLSQAEAQPWPGEQVTALGRPPTPAELFSIREERAGGTDSRPPELGGHL